MDPDAVVSGYRQVEAGLMHESAIRLDSLLDSLVVERRQEALLTLAQAGALPAVAAEWAEAHSDLGRSRASKGMWRPSRLSRIMPVSQRPGPISPCLNLAAVVY